MDMIEQAKTIIRNKWLSEKVHDERTWNAVEAFFDKRLEHTELRKVIKSW